MTVLLLALTVFPTLYSLWLSLTDRTAAGENTGFVGLRNYTDLFGSAQLRHAFWLTLVFCVAAVVVEVVLGFAIAHLLHGLRREHRVLRALLILPMAATPVAVLFGWKVMLDPSQGVLNYLLGLIGAPQPDWLGTPTAAMGTMIMVDVWMWTPFVIVILLGALSSLPQELVEASHVDGAGWFGRLRHVVLPHVRPFLVLAVLFRGIDCLKAFDAFQVLTAGGPGDATTTLNMLAYRTGLQFLGFGKGAAVSVLLLAVALVFGKVAMRFIRREVRA
ncbi:carbohydrate ABC transporter permease [Actinomadura violacea]|uniref:Sugar ABC transporter permease n=1 Tax=Actinomadura violacea TaxID=2819934 RepID=A0ABS3S3Y1_9ACTN|nr:sugar ABC transporter permease [Actinomadura violacea]MBO2463611.1 sugar ABC transporter permease [Actinomadura violacea]